MLNSIHVNTSYLHPHQGFITYQSKPLISLQLKIKIFSHLNLVAIAQSIQEERQFMSDRPHLQEFGDQLEENATY